MIDDLLIKQEAETRGITVNDEAVENTVQDYFGYDPTQVALIGTPATETPVPDPTNTPFVSPTPSSTPLPTATPTEIPAEATVEVTAEATEDVIATATIPPSPTPSKEERLEDFEKSVDLFRENLRSASDTNNAQIDAFFERQTLRDALLEEVVTTDNMALYVNARHILVDTEEEANEIIAALESGEPFASLAQARSTDTGSGARGGELGWASIANYVPEFKEAVTNGEIGAILDPVESQFGFHIIQVRAREEREIEGSEREQLRQIEFAEWVENLREENEDNISTNDKWPNFLPAN
jgi:parvulin-like peptidyl-prolyl isomerase